jgi:hypothetical protein
MAGFNLNLDKFTCENPHCMPDGLDNNSSSNNYLSPNVMQEYIQQGKCTCPDT